MKIIISGTSTGIGKSIAEKFLNEGHEVFGLDIKESRIENPCYHHIVADVTKKMPSLPEADVIISNAGVFDEEKAIEVNLKGAINFVEAYKDSPYLKSVLFVASSSARNGAEFPLYSASKGGLVTYMKNLAVSLAARGITVNSVSPGAVITESNGHLISDKKKFEAIANESLLKKWAKPEEIAEWVYFLTVVNKSMTGEDLLIDNGEILKSNFIW
ncbi:MAG: SDR family oxidoreductase [Bacilli bacterium]|nr:SDR family oxidoreductase [Bacilli bacterium]